MLLETATDDCIAACVAVLLHILCCSHVGEHILLTTYRSVLQYDIVQPCHPVFNGSMVVQCMGKTLLAEQRLTRSRAV